jgi:hypothetical protein
MAIKRFDEMAPGDYGKYVRRRAKQISDAEAMRNFSKKDKRKIKVITNPLADKQG